MQRSLFVDGQWFAGDSQAEPVFNPTMGESIDTLAEASEERINLAVSAAGRAFPRWTRTPPPERAATR